MRSRQKSNKELVSEKFESYIKYSVKRLESQILREDSLLAKLRSQLKEINVFHSKVRLIKSSHRTALKTLSSNEMSLNHNSLKLKAFQDYESSSLVKRLMMGAPVFIDNKHYREQLTKDNLDIEARIPQLRKECEVLAKKLSQSTIEIDGFFYIGDDYRKKEYYKNKEKSIERKIKNILVRREALDQALRHVKEKDHDIQLREHAAEKEVGKYKAYTAAYFGESRKHAEAIKKDLLNQEKKLDGCPYCGKVFDSVPHADHIYPISKGGLSTEENMVFVCSQCNLKKGSLTLREFVAKFNMSWSKIERNLEFLQKTF